MRSGCRPLAPDPAPGPSQGIPAHVQHRRRAARGRHDQQRPCRGQPPEQREVARAEDPEGKARSSQNALKHGLWAQKYVVLPEEDVAEFEALEAAMIQGLAPVGAPQTVLARRVAMAAWRLARADSGEGG